MRVLLGLMFILFACGSVDNAGTCIFEGCDNVPVPQDGKDGENGINGTQGLPGRQGNTGSAGRDGLAGNPGVNGTNGVDGERGDKGERGDTGAKGDSGDVGAIGPQGPVGPNGPKGDVGETGEPGISCTVNQLSSGAVITCPNGSTAVITNGEDGQAGLNAVVEIIDPCGPTGNAANEIILRLANNKLLAWYLNVGLVILTPGNWQTTDAQHCPFTVTINNEVL